MSPRHLLYSLIALPIALLVAFDFGCMPFVSTHTLRTIASTSTRSLRPVRPIRPLPAQARLGGITLPFAALFGSSAAQTQIAKSNSGNHEMSGEQPKVQKSEGEWQAVLSPEQVSPARVTR
jgi:hypothetical protein